MNSPERLPAETRKPVTGYLWGALAVLTSAPAAVLGDALGTLQASTGRLVEGGMADICIIDPAVEWTVAADTLRSQGKHTPFTGYPLRGRVRYTLVGGHQAFEA